ncbi:MAG: putative PEP-binding protein [Halocynthiibacter sp.]
MSNPLDFVEITPAAQVAADTHGGRAKCLQRLIRLDLPVPKTLALSFDAVHAIAAGQVIDTKSLLAHFGSESLVSVRPSSEDPDWGGPGATLNIGMNDARYAALSKTLGEAAANVLYARFIQAYAVHVERLDPDMFDLPKGPDRAAVDEMLRNYELETDTAFPQDASVQLLAVLRSMARAWEGTTARLLRQAKGAPADAGLGLVVQEMALGVGQGESGSGVIQFIDATSGLKAIKGRFRSQSQGRDALIEGDGVMYLTKDPRGASMEERCGECFDMLVAFGDRCRTGLREEMQVEFTIENKMLFILDAVRVPRTSRAAVRVAVTLADDGIISQEEALLRVEPSYLTELMHPQADPDGERDVLVTGVPASPGAAAGKLVFTADAAQSYNARDEACILVRRETAPEDIRGMTAAKAVLTERGGITSHAAMIARGLGIPCVVGASDMEIDLREKTLTFWDGRVLTEGDVMSVDGSAGQALMGEIDMLEAALDGAFKTLLSWADAVRDIDVRANADTPADARTAKMFKAQGIGLCRTEHMFFDEDRLTVMREMIFTDSAADREAALERLLPMQRADFMELFEIMRGKPVCIRLFDPPLHEFLPLERAGQLELAAALDLPLSDVTRRIDALNEVNPMLGMRGVRLGIIMPEIYDMQARAIFEATILTNRGGDEVVPEIMVPLVSAKREVELVKARIDAVAAAVGAAYEEEIEFHLGVMVETPRAALRAGDIASHASFLSFGTNDLTQMTYGLSRDDAGRFMMQYVQQGVFPEDPFHVLDFEGVGELLELGAERGRTAKPEITMSICGEHGGNPESIAFCRKAGFDYVSCSPYRVPIARLAAAQLKLLDDS